MCCELVYDFCVELVLVVVGMYGCFFVVFLVVVF